MSYRYVLSIDVVIITTDNNIHVSNRYIFQTQFMSQPQFGWPMANMKVVQKDV